MSHIVWNKPDLILGRAAPWLTIVMYTIRWISWQCSHASPFRATWDMEIVSFWFRQRSTFSHAANHGRWRWLNAFCQSCCMSPSHAIKRLIINVNKLHRVSKTSHLWFAITLTHVNGFWHFLSEMLPIKSATKDALQCHLKQLVLLHYLAKWAKA